MTYYIHTLGCKVNSYESQVMSDLLENNGYIKGTSLDSDIVIVNTCCVTNVAAHKSLQMIRKLAKSNKLVIVTGCLSQVNAEVIKQIPNVGIILGNKDKSKIVDYIKNYQQQQIVKIYDIMHVEFEDMCLNNFEHTRAFVKIQDGCNNFCSYCIIPYTRGNVRSKKKEDVLKEITTLVEQGHSEIVLTGIHTGNYGCEFKNYDFANLLEDIVKINGLERLRISSIEITELNDRVLNMIKKSNILVDHMHIPLQSGSDTILNKMNRKYDVAYFIDKINQIRQIRPNISITTDVIVGFPYETDELFLETIATINKIKFSKIHVFPFSVREGTKAQEMHEYFVDEKIKKERVQTLLNLSKQLEMEYMYKFLNKEMSFIPETYKDGYLIGHTGNYLLIKTKGLPSMLHQTVKVKIDELQYPFCLSTICQKSVNNKKNIVKELI